MSNDIVQVLAELAGMTGPQLKQRWQELLGTPAPAYNRQTVYRRLAYLYQSLHYGGQSEAIKTRLAEVRESMNFDPQHGWIRRGVPTRKKKWAGEPGQVITREWNGEIHELKVLERGFQYRGRILTSLSAAAFFVTGVRRNGKVFWLGRKGELDSEAGGGKPHIANASQRRSSK